MKKQEILDYLNGLFPRTKSASFMCAGCAYRKHDAIGSEVCAIMEVAFLTEKDSCPSFHDWQTAYSICLECNHRKRNFYGGHSCVKNEPSFEDEDLFCESCTATPFQIMARDNYKRFTFDESDS